MIQMLIRMAYPPKLVLAILHRLLILFLQLQALQIQDL